MRTIAAINHDLDFLDLLEEVVREEGWAFVACPDMDDAFDRVKNSQPHAVLLDSWLGSAMDGWDLLDRFREDHVTRDIPVVLCTGDVFALREREDWLAENGIPFLRKPFELDDLRSALRAA